MIYIPLIIIYIIVLSIVIPYYLKEYIKNKPPHTIKYYDYQGHRYIYDTPDYLKYIIKNFATQIKISKNKIYFHTSTNKKYRLDLNSANINLIKSLDIDLYKQ